MKLMALFYFVLSLFGIDVGGSTLVHRTSANGVDTLYSKATVQAGVARFECLRSASGQCYYTVYSRECASAATGKRNGTCRSEPVERFALITGDSRQIAGLHDFRLCVSTESGAARPECERPEPLATR